MKLVLTQTPWKDLGTHRVENRCSNPYVAQGWLSWVSLPDRPRKKQQGHCPGFTRGTPPFPSAKVPGWRAGCNVGFPGRLWEAPLEGAPREPREAPHRSRPRPRPRPPGSHGSPEEQAAPGRGGRSRPHWTGCLRLTAGGGASLR